MNQLLNEPIIVPRLINTQTVDFNDWCTRMANGSTVTAADVAAVMKQIEDTRKHRQHIGVIRDRLSGVSTHNAALFNHVAQWKVLDWFRDFMIKKGIIGKDYMIFLQELSKRDRGKVAEQADRLIEELERS